MIPNWSGRDDSVRALSHWSGIIVTCPDAGDERGRIAHGPAVLEGLGGTGFGGYDGWIARANNAALGVQAAYDGQVPEFMKLFEAQGQDFPRFYAEVKRLAALPKAQRRDTLAALR